MKAKNLNKPVKYKGYSPVKNEKVTQSDLVLAFNGILEPFMLVGHSTDEYGFINSMSSDLILKPRHLCLRKL